MTLDGISKTSTVFSLTHAQGPDRLVQYWQGNHPPPATHMPHCLSTRPRPTYSRAGVPSHRPTASIPNLNPQAANHVLSQDDPTVRRNATTLPHSYSVAPNHDSFLRPSFGGACPPVHFNDQLSESHAGMSIMALPPARRLRRSSCAPHQSSTISIPLNPRVQ